jgi:uncharacterized protein (DUF2062 family)
VTRSDPVSIGSRALGNWRQRAAAYRRTGWRRLRGGELTPLRTAGSVGFGLFVGCLPLYGLHLPLCLLVCVPLRLDAAVAYLAANISNPLVAPWLLLLEVQTGSLLIDGKLAPFSVSAARASGISGYVSFGAVGAVVVGATVAGLGAIAAGAIAARVRARLSSSSH